jgi:hypothetical protein
MATPAPKDAAPEGTARPASSDPSPKAARARAAKAKRGASQPKSHRARKPEDARGRGPRIPTHELALPQAAPRYDKKGRYMPTVYIYQETNGEFRILSPGGNGDGAPAKPAAPAAEQPAAPPGTPQGSAPAQGPAEGGAEAEGRPAEAPRP